MLVKKSSLLFLFLAACSQFGCDPASSKMQSEKGTSTPFNASAKEKPVTPPEVQRHNFGDFAFVIPEGWQVAPPEAGKTKAKIYLLDQSQSSASGLIVVESGKPAIPDARKLAEAMAKNFFGSLSESEAPFDGEPGYGFVTSSRTMEAPRTGAVTIRNGSVYMLMGSGNENVDIDAAITSIRNSWKWSEAGPAE